MWSERLVKQLYQNVRCVYNAIISKSQGNNNISETKVLLPLTCNFHTGYTKMRATRVPTDSFGGCFFLADAMLLSLDVITQNDVYFTVVNP